MLAAGMLAVPLSSFAQINRQNALPVAFYRHVEPGQATMQVRVWGDVVEAGIYEVQAGTDLLELIFLAGGPAGGIGRSAERRSTAIQLSRKGNDVWGIIFEADLDALTGQRQPYPSLLDGDALKIDVEVRRVFSWRDGFTIVGAVGTIALVIDRISRISSR